VPALAALIKGTSKIANRDQLNSHFGYNLENSMRAHCGPERFLG
jgi:hypothetical protein